MEHKIEKRYWKKYRLQSWFVTYYNAVMLRLKNNHLLSSKYKRELIDNTETQHFIFESIKNNVPIMVSRFGCFEARCLGEGFGIQLGIKKKYSDLTLKTMFNNAGVFPYGQVGAQQFFDITKEAIQDIDLLGVWTTEMQSYLVDVKCRNDMVATDLVDLAPFRSNCPWSQALKGKKVVVVHPFKETIEKQYKNRELLFDNSEVLPHFDLRVVRAVQTIAGQNDPRFKEWKDALEYMYKECMKEDFDVAIIGCGAYGMPLASMLKRAGKIAIHLGGVTQLLFGIKGKRWDNTGASKFYNEYWVRPAPNEKPQNANHVENGCYW